MRTTFTEQMQAIRQAMREREEYLQSLDIIREKVTAPSEDKHWSALNDAASSIAALKIHVDLKAKSDD